MRTFHNYLDRLTGIRYAWEKYISEGIQPDTILRPEILSSWERSMALGVNPYQQKVEKNVSKNELIEFKEQNEKFLHLVIKDMDYLTNSIEESDTLVTISDKNGLILHTHGNEHVKKEAQKINFLPGALWGENVAGTNAIGTVIQTQKPTQISFTEHFSVGWHEWFCAGAPIFNPFTQELLGVLDLSGKWKNTNPHTLGLVIAKANHITMHIEQLIYNEGIQMNPFFQTMIDTIDDGIMIADAKKNILRMNQIASIYFYDIARTQSLINYPKIEELVDLVLKKKAVMIEEEVREPISGDSFICMVRPVAIDEHSMIGVLIRLRRGRKIVNASAKVVELPTEVSDGYTFNHLIGESPAFVQAVKKAQKAAVLQSTLLLRGETGTGKELFAQAIHNASDRRDGPFVAINCGAIPRELIESELFGYEKGAFTGANQKGKKGKFELAEGGTLFLDEIGDMQLDAQVHLLRVLQEKAIMRIGGGKTIPINVRIIAATHRNLAEAVENGLFREDLFFRLRVIQLDIPSLRDRSTDIPRLVQHYINQLKAEFGKDVIHVDSTTMELLQSYSWPGNIRELRNVIEQALFNMEGQVILPSDVPEELRQEVKCQLDHEKHQYTIAIQAASGNVSQAAERLGVSRATMYRKIKQLGITPKVLS